MVDLEDLKNKLPKYDLDAIAAQLPPGESAKKEPQLYTKQGDGYYASSAPALIIPPNLRPSSAPKSDSMTEQQRKEHNVNLYNQLFNKPTPASTYAAKAQDPKALLKPTSLAPAYAAVSQKPEPVQMKNPEIVRLQQQFLEAEKKKNMTPLASFLGYTGKQIAQGAKDVGTNFFNAVKGEVASQLDVNATNEKLRRLGIPIPEPVNSEKAMQNQAMLAKSKSDLEKSIIASAQKSAQERAAIDAAYPNLTPFGKTAGQLIGVTGQVAPIAAAGMVNPMLGKQLLYGMASGSEISDALQTGADIQQAKKAGIASGVAELSIEKLFGGIPGLGKGAINPDDLVKKYIQSPAGRAVVTYLTNAVGEGAEEVASELLSPFIKRYYYNPDAPMPTFDELAMAFGGGAVASGILGSVNLSSDIKRNNAEQAMQKATDQKAVSDYMAQGNAIRQDVGSLDIAPRQVPGSTFAPNYFAKPEVKPDYSKKFTPADFLAKPQKTVTPADFIPNPIARQAAQPTVQQKMALDEYLGLQGLGSPISDYSVDKMRLPHGESERQQAQRIATGLQTAQEYSDKRQAAIREYNEKVQRGEIVPKTRTEQLIRTAQGHDDNEAVQAARRILDKRGIGWKTENAITVSTQPSVQQPFGVNTVGAAMKKDGESVNDLLMKHGSIPDGETPARLVDLPLKNEKGEPISWAARTIAESKVSTDAEVDLIDSMIESGELAHEVVTDKSAMRSAENAIKENGFADALGAWNIAVRDNDINKKTIALGQTIYNQAVQNRDIPLIKKMIADLAIVGTQSGQNLQAQRMLKKMTPDGQLYALEQSVRKINEDILMTNRKGFEEIEIPPELSLKLLDSTSKAETDAAVSDIQQYIADRIPSNWFDKWNAWRYLSMLGNPRTHIRNIVGNAVFMPAVKTKNLIANGIEKGVNAFLPTIGKEQIQRTKAVTFDKSIRDFAKSDFAEVESVVRGGGKHNPSDAINDKRRIFNNKLLESARKLNTGALEAEDVIFLKAHYADSLASYMAANKLTPEYFKGNTPESNQALNAARNYAIQEAQKATFRDANALASFLNNSKRKLMAGNAGMKAGGVLMEGFLPFTKTPANILRRGVEYSPAWLIKALTYDLAQVKKGGMTATQAIDNIASGLTGTGVVAVGMWLASLGLISGGRDDDKKQSEFDRLQGAQNYALQLGDKSYTIDWAAPIALPLFVGVETQKMLKESGTTGGLTDWLNAFSRMAEPMTELSMLQGVNNTIKAAAYGENALTDMLWELATSYVSQGVPTASGQISRAVDPVRRNTSFVDKNSPVPDFLQKPINRAVAKIPFASKTLPPMLDQWGREQENAGGSFAGRLAANMLSPGYIGENKTTPLETELQRLYKQTGDTKVLPTYAAKFLNLGGEKLNFTADQYIKYSSVRGKLSQSVAGGIVSNPAYSKLSDELKADAIASAYDYANDMAKAEAAGAEPSKRTTTVNELQKKYNITPEVYFVAYAAQKDIKGTPDGKGGTVTLSASKNKKAAVDKATPGLNAIQRRGLYIELGISEKVW